MPETPAIPEVDPTDEGSAKSSIHAARLRSAAKGRRRKLSRHSPVADALWEDMYSRLSAFKATHGHFNVPTYYEGRKSLGMWCQRQRHHRRRGMLAPIRVSRLDAIGFPWDPMNGEWEENWQSLLRFIKEHGHCRVVPSLVGGTRYPGLLRWVRRQREMKVANQVREDRASRLESVGFEWATFHRPWESKYAALIAYQGNYGKGTFPDSGSPEMTLVVWLERQRRKYRHGTLHRERVRRLEKLGMDWSPVDSKREEMLKALRHFRKRHGHCNVSRSYKGHPGLAQYILTLRGARRAGRLSPERISELEKIGLRWDGSQAYLDACWQESLKKLAVFKRIHGHCDVPTTWARDPWMARWVQLQRQRKAAGQLLDAQRQALDALGFTWRVRERRWERYYEALKAFVQTHGHCRVTERSQKDQRLFRWVCFQRTAWRNGSLATDRVGRLDQLGFDWAPKGRAPQ